VENPIEKHLAQVQPFINQRVEIEQFKIEIQNQNDVDLVNSKLDLAKKIKKDVEKKRKEIIKPFNDFVKKINDKIKKDVTIPLDNFIAKLKAGLWKYEIEQRKIQEEKLKSLEIEKEPELESQEMPISSVVDELPQATGIKTVKRWTYEVIDLEKVPRKYLQIDHKMVMTAIAAGQLEIDGLKIFEEESVK
jgi:hypothetical protein